MVFFKKFDANELSDLAVKISHMTSQNMISAIEEQKSLDAVEKDRIELMASIAATAIANFILCLQQEEPRSGQPDQILPQ